MYLLYVDLNSAFNIIVMTFYLHLEGCARACRRAGKDSKAGRKSQHKAGATRKPRPSQKGKPVWQREARKASQEGKPARQGKKASQKGKPERQASQAKASKRGKQERQAGCTWEARPTSNEATTSLIVITAWTSGKRALL